MDFGFFISNKQNFTKMIHCYRYMRINGMKCPGSPAQVDCCGHRQIVYVCPLVQNHT